MAKKITVLFVVLWIAVATSLCRGWGEEAIQDAMDKAKLGAEEAKKGASEAMQNAKDKTGSSVDMASNKFNEEFGYAENNGKDGFRRFIYEAKNFECYRDAVNNAEAQRSTFHKTLKLASKLRYFEQRRSHDSTCEFLADKLRRDLELVAQMTNPPTKQYSRRIADEALEYFVNELFDTVEMVESVQRMHIKRRKEKCSGKVWKLSEVKEKFIENVGVDDVVLQLLFSEDGPELLKKYNEAQSNIQETHTIDKETMNQKAKEKYEEAKERASQARAELGKLIGADL